MPTNWFDVGLTSFGDVAGRRRNNVGPTSSPDGDVAVPMPKLRCAGGREFDHRPGQYSRMSFSSDPGDWYGFLI